MARPRKQNNKTRMTISFTEFDEDVYDFLESQKNTSRFIKFLVKEYMNGNMQITKDDSSAFLSLNKSSDNLVNSYEVRDTKKPNESKAEPKIVLEERDNSNNEENKKFALNLKGLI